MKRIGVLFGILLVVWSVQAFAASPVIFFSDLTSGPNTGGQDNKGAFVTIWGKNFGSSRGTSYVTVGGGQVDNYPVWTDAKISFQLGSNAQSGNITVTTSEGTSNGVSFTVRSGNIYFVDVNSPNNPGSGTYNDPWRSPRSAWETMTAGDTVYLKAGVYTGSYATVGDSNYNFSFGSGSPDGTYGNEIAYVAYPGETVRIEADAENRTRCFATWNDYYVISGFQCYSRGRTMELAGSHNRVIGNSIEGNKGHYYGQVQIFDPCADMKIYGNEIFGATGDNKLDHPIYVSRTSTNVDIGWNYLHDNQVSYGPIISIHQDGSGSTFTNIRIHDNILDGTGVADGIRAIFIGDMTAESAVYIYNNIIRNCGPKSSFYEGVIYRSKGNAYIYNNTLYNVEAGSSQILWNSANSGTVEIKNNIVYLKNGSADSYINWASGYEPVIDANCYYGNGNGPAEDTNAVNANPQFINTSGDDFHLQSISPAKDAGTSDVSSVVTRDYDGVLRPQGSGYDIGAYEYGGFYLPPPSNLNATASSETAVLLAWTDNSSNEDGFRVERREYPSGSYSVIATVGRDVFVYNDTGLEINTTYYYRVQAFINAQKASSGGTYSGYSNEAFATTGLTTGGTPSASSGGGGGGGGGCFIATAAYGDESAPEVVILKKFRDEYLLHYSLGKRFIAFYYKHSPSISEWMRNKPWVKKITRIILTPIVNILSCFIEASA